MTDSSIIQRARDVLAKYRSYAGTAQDWALRGGTSRLILIVSDPDPLDAIDGLLDAAAFNIAQDPLGHTHATVARALDIAAAIVTAEERMSA